MLTLFVFVCLLFLSFMILFVTASDNNVYVDDGILLTFRLTTSGGEKFSRKSSMQKHFMARG